MKREVGIILVSLLVLLAGCKQTETAAPTGKAFVGGSQGLVMSFLPSQPPAEIFDKDNPFQIAVKLENKGEFDIESAANILVSITGINPSNFKVSQEQLAKTSPDALNGVSVDGSGNTITGDYTTIDFPEMNYYADVQGSVIFPIRANVCYEYGTKAQGKLCVREDLRGTTGTASVCDPNRATTLENSGAPVQVVNMRQNVAGSNKIDIFFTVKKVGAATDTLHKSGTQCDTAIANRDIVYVTVSDTGLGQLVCSGLQGGTATAGYITLFNGEREIRCSQTVDNPIDAETPIEVDLKYSYKQFIDTTLNVKHTS